MRLKKNKKKNMSYRKWKLNKLNKLKKQLQNNSQSLFYPCLFFIFIIIFIIILVFCITNSERFSNMLACDSCIEKQNENNVKITKENVSTTPWYENNKYQNANVFDNNC